MLMISMILDVILPVVLPAVFSADKRFLCDTAYEALEALVLHCSGRKLARQLLQFGAEQDDLRLVNLVRVSWSCGSATFYLTSLVNRRACM